MRCGSGVGGKDNCIQKMRPDEIIARGGKPSLNLVTPINLESIGSWEWLADMVNHHRTGRWTCPVCHGGIVGDGQHLPLSGPVIR